VRIVGFAARGAALHVDDLVVADREDLEAFVTTLVAASQWVEPMILAPTESRDLSICDPQVARSDSVRLGSVSVGDFLTAPTSRADGTCIRPDLLSFS
jgi:hypothetical protein